MYTHSHTRTHEHTHNQAGLYTFTRMYTHSHTRTQEHTHTHTHTQAVLLPSDGMALGLQCRYLLEKWDSTRSLSCVSPMRANSFRKALEHQDTKQALNTSYVSFTQ